MRSGACSWLASRASDTVPGMVAKLATDYTTPATYRDLETAPENMVAELVNGVLHLSPRPRIRHGNTHSAIIADVRGGYGRRTQGGGWHIITEPECHLELDRIVLVPEVGGWLRERLPELPDSHKMTLVPDWICEVLSLSTQTRDYLVKLPQYLAHGVEWAWIVAVATHVVDVFRAQTNEAGQRAWKHVIVAEGDVRVRLPPFEDVELDLADWWDSPRSA